MDSSARLAENLIKYRMALFMLDLFRLKLVSKRQVTIPQRVLDLLGLQQGDEIHIKISNGKIVQAYAVNVTPNLEMSEEAQGRFAEIEKERAASGAADTDLSGLMDEFLDARRVFPDCIAPGQSGWAGSLPRTFGYSRIAPLNFQRSDERIAELVAEWMAEAQLDVSKVEIFAEKGEVTLRGMMNDKKGRLMAELVARSVLGVAEVHNEIEVAVQRLVEVGPQTVYQGSEKSIR